MNRMAISTWTWRAAGALAFAAAVVGAACGGASAGAPAPSPTPTEPPPSASSSDAAKVYRRALNEFEDANYTVAEAIVDSLVESTDGGEWLALGLLLSARASIQLNRLDPARLKLARYLTLYRASDPARVTGLVLIAEILYLEGRPLEAADSLLAAPAVLGDAREKATNLARQVASELGIREIESLTERWPADHPLVAIFEIERASLLLAAGETERGKEVAEAALALSPPEADRDRAENIVSGDMETEQWRPIVGAVLPLSGPLAPYGRLAEEGVRLAIAEYNARHIDSVTLIIRDDRDDSRRSGELVRELERLGAVAIVGPLRTEGLEEASRRRGDRNLLIVSPTAPENVSFRRNVYSLWSSTERVSRGARALADFAVNELQLYRFGVIYPNTPEGRTQLAAFADAVRARGAEITATVAYNDTATTFQDPLTFLGEARPQAIYAPASAPRTVIQLAPQFSFYGLRGVQVLGDADWSAPEVLRLVEPRFINGTVVSTFLNRSSPAVRWPEFVELYERAYRKGLQETLVPALAFDATNLILAALPWGYPRRSAIARTFRETRGTPGATGIFYVEDRTLLRRPFILHVRDRELVPAFEELERFSTPVGGGRGPQSQRPPQ